MSSRLLLLLSLLVVFSLVMRENLSKRPDQLHQLTDGRIDMCLGEPDSLPGQPVDVRGNILDFAPEGPH